MKDEYRREMEQLGPRQEELERLYTMIEGGTFMKRKMKLGCRAVAAIAVCAVLMVSAAAAAAPTVWDALMAQLGVFAPYSQTIEGVSCTDQGIEIQVLRTLADDLTAQIYFTVQDVEQDRLDQLLTLTGRLTAGVEQQRDEKDPSVFIGGGFPSTRYFTLVSYEPETKTALLSATIHYYEDAQPTREAELSITGMTTRLGTLYSNVVTIPCASVTGEVLKSLPVGKNDTVILTPGDVVNSGYTNSILPSKKVVLAPGQTPMAIKGTEDMRVSSMGFASDGCFHILLDFAEGVKRGRSVFTGELNPLFCTLWDGVGGDDRLYTFQETLMEGGGSVDILFPLITVDDLGKLQSCEAGLYGDYLRPGTDIEGNWSVQFELEYYPSATLDWTGELDGCQVRQVTISPLSVTMYSNNTGTFADAELCAVMKDGTTVTAEPGSGRYANMEAVGGKGYDAFNTWKFTEPVEVEDIVSLTLRGGTIPVN